MQNHCLSFWQAYCSIYLTRTLLLDKVWYNLHMKIVRFKVTLIILFLIFLTMTYLFSPIFAVRSISVPNIYDQPNTIKVIEQTNIRLGENLNIFLLRKGNILSGHLVSAENALMQDTYKKQVSVIRTTRNDIDIDFNLRLPVMCILYDDYLLYCDYDGTVFESERTKKENSFLIRGIELDYFYLGFNLKTCNYMFEPLSLLCYEIEKYDISNHTAIRALIDSITIQDNGEILINYDGRLEITLNMTKDVKYNANVMCALLSEMNQDAKGYIDFTISSNPYFTPAS